MPNKRINLAGKIFGRLTVLSFSHRNRPPNHGTYWICGCKCGNNKTVRASDLKTSAIKSCGCLRIEKTRKRGLKRGYLLQKKMQKSLAAGKRKCPDCQQLLLLERFSRNTNNASGLTNICKNCLKPRSRAQNLKRHFNLTVEDYDALFQFQKGVCAICGRPPKKIRLGVDHEHKSGLIRGAICWGCNSMLGKARDNPDLLRRAAEYLEHPPATQALGAPRYGRIGRVNKKIRKKKTK